MADIIKIKNEMGEELYPITKPECVIDEHGKDVLQLIRESGGGGAMISVTYAELVRLRNNGGLVPGMQYRITDYVTTTAENYTASAGHQFDIIVTADSENTLNELARACLHEGDTYFSDAEVKLEAWQIWYSLDNTPRRFAWAATDKTAFVRAGTRNLIRPVEKLDEPLYIEGDLIVYRSEQDPDGDLLFYAENGGSIYNEDNIDVASNYKTELPKGVIYRMIDEWGNDCPYDFKNIMFIKKIADDGSISIEDTAEGDWVYLYTFSYVTEGLSVIDASIFGNYNLRNDEAVVTGVYDNSIKAYYEAYAYGMQEAAYGCQHLNRILFYANEMDDVGTFYGFNTNKFDTNCFRNILCHGCEQNTFKTWCWNNYIGMWGASNTFGKNNNKNHLEQGCTFNKFEDGCSQNSLGDSCGRNEFKEGANNNLLGASVLSCILDEAHDNKLGDDCTHIHLGKGVRSCTFPSDCFNVTYSAGCHDLIVPDGCQLTSTEVGDNCGGCTLQGYNIVIASNVHNLELEAPVENVRIINSGNYGSEPITRSNVIIGFNSEGEVALKNIADLFA